MSGENIEIDEGSAEAIATPDQANAPVAKADRIASLDFIRGIAVLGILAANIVSFGQPFNAYIFPDAFLTEHGPTEDWMWVAQFILIDGKMRGLFTLLFGAGLALFMERAWERGATRWLQVRRLAWLLLFGLFHFFFLWRGDILALYATAGFVAVLFLRWAARDLMVIGVLGYLGGAVLMAAMISPGYFVAETSLGDKAPFTKMRTGFDEAKQKAMDDDALEAKILTEGNYADFVTHNFTKHGTDPLITLSLFLLETLPLMLIGMGLYKFGLFSGGFDARRQRLWGWAGLIVGTALTVPIALWAHGAGLTYWSSIAALSGFAGVPRLPVILGLAALLALWGSHANGWLAQRFSAAGRAAFTNYLGTSFVMMLVFHPWAGGLWGELTRGELYLVVLGAWVVMLAWSKPWLERYRYGPLEWLWRCLTYWKRFPLKR
ncbi:DUF418 domain-containing protein [Erythrobacter sp. HKB08]|uniref:DUF418 domain-containing protein n=1 Tax=Erythrobacter sp. HKB08 TaxID=2502843 RepID=UPI001008797F|nr:DUF418 domain-containing protein [Erythrobacter sp. HKB08]